MAHSLKDFDAWKTGENDKNAPFNQKEEDYRLQDLESCFEDNDQTRFDELLSDVRKEVKQLRELCKQTNKDGNKDFLINRLTKIYSKL